MKKTLLITCTALLLLNCKGTPEKTEPAKPADTETAPKATPAATALGKGSGDAVG